MVAADTDLPARVRLLLAPPPRRARATQALVLAAAVACAVSGGVAVAQGHAQVERVQLSAQSVASSK
jgi:hypothetical protein